MPKNNDKLPIPQSLDDAEKYMKEHVGLEASFDLGVRKLKILKKNVHFYYVNGLCDTSFIVHIVEELVDINDNEKLSTHLQEIVENRITHQSVDKIKTMDELVDQVLSGLIEIGRAHV